MRAIIDREGFLAAFDSIVFDADKENVSGALGIPNSCLSKAEIQEEFLSLTIEKFSQVITELLFEFIEFED